MVGEYFVWMNPKKRQCLGQHACDDFGWMFSIATTQRCDLTEVACMLINGAWSGDPVIFAGDYLSFGGGECQSRDDQRAMIFGEHPYESCYGSEYEELGAPEDIMKYRYAINESRREYVDRDATPLSYVCELPDGKFVWSRCDPVPVLFSPIRDNDKPYGGRWCLDDVRMSHEPAPAGYMDISACYTNGDEVVLLEDCEIEELLHGDAFQEAIVKERMRGASPDIELHGAVNVIARIVKEAGYGRYV